jgi:hypothetical protein
VLIASAQSDQKSTITHPRQCFKDLDNDRSINKDRRLELIFDKALENETGFSKEQRKEALNLLMSGKFTSDLHDLVVIILSLPQKALNAAPSTVTELLSLPKDLSSCLRNL